MIYQLYSIFDHGVSAFAAPVMATSEIVIRRSLADLFASELNRAPLERAQYVRYPGDYSLWHVGTFDVDTGLCVALSPVVRVCSLEDFIP